MSKKERLQARLDYLKAPNYCIFGGIVWNLWIHCNTTKRLIWCLESASLLA